jgi:hypothetical protein
MDGRIMLSLFWDSVGWIHMAQDRDQWQAPVNEVRNL